MRVPCKRFRASLQELRQALRFGTFPRALPAVRRATGHRESNPPLPLLPRHRFGRSTGPCCARCGRPFVSAVVLESGRGCPSVTYVSAAFMISILPAAYGLYRDHGRRHYSFEVPASNAVGRLVCRQSCGRPSMPIAKGAGRTWSCPCPLTRSGFGSAVTTKLNSSPGRWHGLWDCLAVLTCWCATVLVPISCGLRSGSAGAAVRGAYTIRHGLRVDNLRVLLVDDVLTTGATLDACSRALRKAGAAKVVALTVARAIPWREQAAIEPPRREPNG